METSVFARTSEALSQAIVLAGSEKKLANAVGVAQSYISKAKRTGRISDRVAIAIHRFTKGQVPGSALRPDLWRVPEHVPVAPDGSAAS